MLDKGIRLPFKAFGIPIRLDISLLIALPLMSWLIARNLPRSLELLHLDAPALLTGPAPYLLGLAAAVGLFVSILLHELGHAVVAFKLYGVRTQSITLWILGGVASLASIPRQPYAEAVVAIVGPLTSLLVGAAFYLPHLLLPHGAWPSVHFLCVYLGLTNLVLAIFNLIPAMPMDGGRVLRSLLAIRMTYARATAVAAGVSKFCAILMGLFGFLTGNLLLLLLAFFVFVAGQSESRQTTFEELLRGLPVRTLMTRDPVTVPPDLPLPDLTQQMFTHHHLGFPVVDPTTDLPIGIVTLRQLSANPAASADAATVRDVMVPGPPTLPLDADASAALRLLAERDEPGRILVLDPDGRLAGILTKTDLTHALQIRAVQADARRPRWEPVPV
jgi:Zn-dependent protease/CBS domain-containing protein